MEETKALRDVENSLRDFLTQTFKEEKGQDWLNNCGISEVMIKKWKKSKENEKKKQKFGPAEERILYYSDFYDLVDLIDKNWSETLEAALGDREIILALLKILKNFRNPDAHRRELLPHQKHLIIGISGEIRNRIIQYRSKQETGDDYFPRLESVKDSLGNQWLPGDCTVRTGMNLRVGDRIQFVATAIDPKGQELEYSFGFRTLDPDWQESNIFEIELQEEHISKSFALQIFIRSMRKYHACGWFDDFAEFTYTILPKKEN